MNFYPATWPRLIAPLRMLAKRFAYGTLVVLSVVIIVIGKADMALVERVRVEAADLVAPVLAVMTRPVAAGEALVERVSDMAGLYAENERLHDENATLLQWQQAARRLETENQALRDLTKYQPGGSVWYITGRVIGTAGGAYSRSLLIDRGAADGIAKGQAATSGVGLVGRMAEVGERSARVLLITDLNSRIPVTLQDSHERGILAGDNGPLPQLIYLAPNAKPVVGERVVTSGEGGVFPPGIPVGAIYSVSGQAVRVAPSADLSVIEYLRVMDFGLGGVLPQSAVPAPRPARKASADGKP